MSRFLDYICFWRNWDDKERSNAKVVLGLAVAVFSLFILISSVSYLFHWQQDMSLLRDPSMMDSATAVGNAAGKMGYRMGHLLICNLFGLGSFALLVILTAISVRLISNRWGFSLFKTTIIALSGALVASLLLAFAGEMAGIPNAFGGGLGGEFGNQVVLWGRNLFGSIISGALVLLLLACWLFFCSPRFTDWVYNLGRRTSEPQDEVVPEDDVQEVQEVSEEAASSSSPVSLRSTPPFASLTVPPLSMPRGAAGLEEDAASSETS